MRNLREAPPEQNGIILRIFPNGVPDINVADVKEIFNDVDPSIFPPMRPNEHWLSREDREFRHDF